MESTGERWSGDASLGIRSYELLLNGEMSGQQRGFIHRATLSQGLRNPPEGVLRTKPNGYVGGNAEGRSGAKWGRGWERCKARYSRGMEVGEGLLQAYRAKPRTGVRSQ